MSIMKKKTEIVITRVKEMPEEEQRAELIRLRDECLEGVATAQRIMGEYAAKANKCAEMLREMDKKGANQNEQKAQKDITFDDGDDWDWSW
jgi:hypothetical protein